MNNPVKSFYKWYKGALRHPQYRWLVMLGTLVYLVSPIDVVPDLFPIVGQVDDLMVLTLLLSELSQIVFDFFKSRQGEVSTSSQADIDAPTVEVDAVPLNK